VANSKGRISTAHAYVTDGIKMAIRRGITSIEHGMMMADECIEMLVKHGFIWYQRLLQQPKSSRWDQLAD
jgi:imidazolonepropionase-like amidohydrolase